MRRPLIALSAALGGLAALRFLVRGRRPARLEPLSPRPDPRAEELRRKLAESQPLVEERAEEETAEQTPAEAAEPVAERRRDVHERGRAAAERMRRPPRETSD